MLLNICKFYKGERAGTICIMKNFLMMFDATLSHWSLHDLCTAKLSSFHRSSSNSAGPPSYQKKEGPVCFLVSTHYTLFQALQSI